MVEDDRYALCDFLAGKANVVFVHVHGGLLTYLVVHN